MWIWDLDKFAEVSIFCFGDSKVRFLCLYILFAEMRFLCGFVFLICRSEFFMWLCFLIAEVRFLCGFGQCSKFLGVIWSKKD
jgi:hypothetical protein